MNRKTVFFGLSLLAFAAILLLPQPPEIETAKGIVALTIPGKASLAVLLAVVILWVSEAVPLFVTHRKGLERDGSKVIFNALRYSTK